MDQDLRSEERRDAERHRRSIHDAQPGVPKRAPKLPGPERKRQILAAAVNVFARHGFEGARTADIAAAAGVQEPTIYRHFDNKRDLYVQAVASTMDQLLLAFRQIVEESDGPHEALRNLGGWYVSKLVDNSAELALRVRAMVDMQDVELRKVVADQYLEFVEIVREQYREMERRGELDPGTDPDMLAWLYLAIGNSTHITWLLDLPDLKWVIVPEQVAKWQKLYKETDSNYLM